jgi:hypothetical protein
MGHTSQRSWTEFFAGERGKKDFEGYLNEKGYAGENSEHEE